MTSLFGRLAILLGIADNISVVVFALGFGILVGFYGHRVVRGTGLARRWLRFNLWLFGLLLQNQSLRSLRSYFADGLGRGLCNIASNARVASDIYETAYFIDLFFAPIVPSGAGRNQVWILGGDLAPFRSRIYFDRLYAERILKLESVEIVKIVVSEKLRPTAEMSDADLRKLQREWSDVLTRVSQDSEVRGRVTSKVRARWERQLEGGTDFSRFVSDEAWILYVRHQTAIPYPKICIHRRFLEVGEVPTDGRAQGERVTITASFPSIHEKLYDDRDPVVRFLNRDNLQRFESIFLDHENDWTPFDQFAGACKSEIDGMLDERDDQPQVPQLAELLAGDPLPG